MKLIVGLGNPGSSYSKTRHNIGRRVVEDLAEEYGASWHKARDMKARWARVEDSELSFVIAFPELFMNESGEAVKRLVSHFKIHSPSDLLIIVDDAALPFGRLRLREKGTDGGHWGLRSVEEGLRSRQYTRLRVGIAPSHPVQISLEEFVLTPFAVKEEREIPSLLVRCRHSCRLWVEGPLTRALNWTNQPLETDREA